MTTRTVSGITFTRNPATGSWENTEHGIKITPRYSGNMCATVNGYIIEFGGKTKAWSLGFKETLVEAARMLRKPHP